MAETESLYLFIAELLNFRAGALFGGQGHKIFQRRGVLIFVGFN